MVRNVNQYLHFLVGIISENAEVILTYPRWTKYGESYFRACDEKVVVSQHPRKVTSSMAILDVTLTAATKLVMHSKELPLAGLALTGSLLTG
jgi:hypothetical protein